MKRIERERGQEMRRVLEGIRSGADINEKDIVVNRTARRFEVSVPKFDIRVEHHREDEVIRLVKLELEACRIGELLCRDFNEKIDSIIVKPHHVTGFVAKFGEHEVRGRSRPKLAHKIQKILESKALAA